MSTMRRDATPPIARHAPDIDLRGRHVYMVGIGGCGMSGLARLLRARGASVSGSDMAASATTAALIGEGIPVGFEQTAGAIPEACDLIVASAAIRPDHPQWLGAEGRGIRVMLYAEALGACMAGQTGVAIAGTHGKSTTTAMLGAALVDAGLDPSVIVGATCGQLADGCLGRKRDPGIAWSEGAGGSSRSHDRGSARTGFRLGAAAIPAGARADQPGLLLAEACEFNRSFHSLRPTVACITSVEADHLDVYGSIEDLIVAFREFAALLPSEREGGHLLIAHTEAHRREITAGLGCAVETIGFAPEADWVVRWDPRTRDVEVLRHGASVARWRSPIIGQHNAMNAATALALGTILGADPARLAASLAAFGGVDRRMQLLGEVRDPAWPDGPSVRDAALQALDSRGSGDAPMPATCVRVIDDYGHHPTEIDATLRALRLADRPERRLGASGLPGRLICVFQPHQHSRTRHLLEEFARSFEQADIVIVPHIYFVRDSQAEKTLVSAGDLVDRLRQRGVNAMHLYPFEAIVEHLQNLCRPGDTLCVMGAGPVNEVAHGYIEAMRRRHGAGRRGAASPEAVGVGT
ncbi:MAG: UDP-N-acetylmuramate--L-alanine ligase [Phycisphaeraceae bacterium]|nr:UDP-N-acetylmuramate--L-alanine ligase [Phycisphaeraceae bacterium]